MTMTKELPPCPVAAALMAIGDRWKVLIARDLLTGTKRFSELKASVGNISQKVLTTKLREMEADGLLTRKVFPEIPPRVEYTLTEIGCTLRDVLDTLAEWGEYYRRETSGRGGGEDRPKTF